MSFKELPVKELNINPVTMLSERWPLLAAGNAERGYNAMTVGWGHVGAIWGLPGRTVGQGMPTAVVFSRPQRYTKEFIDREELFTLSVLPASYKKELTYLGTVSGRDGDKIAKSGLTPVFADGTVYFGEAEMVFVCRKLYHAPLAEEGFVEKAIIGANYPDKDFHEMYIGEILKVLVNKD